MIFDNFLIDEAEGCLLAHTLRTEDWVIKKGTFLDTDMIGKLRDAGMEHVTAVRLADEDVGEDEAALAVGRKMAGEGVYVKEPVHGRCNLVADSHGIAVLNAEGIEDFNLSKGDAMVATVAPFEVVKPKGIVAKIKVIPYGVPKSELDTQLSILQEPIVSVSPFKPLKAGMILTRALGTKDKLLQKAERTMADRLEVLGGTLASVEHCEHDYDAVSTALRKMVDQGFDLVLLLGATSTSDVADVIPAAIQQNGGRLCQVGIPVEPGNLLVMGDIEEIPVVGLPGCARSQCLNGIDLVLPRLMAGLPVGADDLMRMGVGGLLAD